MSKTQRLTFLGIAVVIAIVAVVVLVGGEETDTSTAETTPTATPTATADGSAAETATPSATPTATPTPPPPPLLQGGKVTKLEFTEGETVKFRVTSDVLEEVHVHGYNIAKDLEPGKVTTVSFPATITGIFEIEYEHAGEQIGQLRVNPK
jgi:heme/copper-type cytochrome/quinol oxidase subunit 2